MERVELAVNYVDGLDRLMTRYQVLKVEPHIVEEFYPEFKINALERIALRGMEGYYNELKRLGLAREAEAMIRDRIIYE